MYNLRNKYIIYIIYKINNMHIKNIILDIDETLIHCKLIEPKEYNHSFVIDKIKYYIIYRPYLEEFINFIFNNFDTINIWTAATQDYAHKIILKILNTKLKNKALITSKLKCFYTRKHVSNDGTKELAKIFNNKCSIKLNIQPHNTVMIDDKSHVFNKNTGNGLIIPAFMGNKKDTNLLKLIHFLKLIQEEKLLINSNEDSIDLSEIFNSYKNKE
jgi:TFIIF-interacting CTD phosphatase-like protein